MPKESAKAPKRVRVRREPEESRRLILEAAIRVLSEAGPEAAGLKEVATEAGVSHALIVHYFGTYDALVKATVLACAQRLRQRLIERAQESVGVTVEGMAEIYLDAVLEPWYGRLVSWALLSDRGGETSYAAQLVPDVKRIGDTMHVLLARSRPGLTRAESDALLVALWSMAVGYVAGNGFFWRALGRTPGPKRDKELRAAVSTALRVMFPESP